MYRIMMYPNAWNGNVEMGNTRKEDEARAWIEERYPGGEWTQKGDEYWVRWPRNTPFVLWVEEVP